MDFEIPYLILVQGFDRPPSTHRPAWNPLIIHHASRVNRRADRHRANQRDFQAVQGLSLHVLLLFGPIGNKVCSCTLTPPIPTNPPTERTLAHASAYLISLAETPKEPETLRWKKILEEEPFEGEPCQVKVPCGGHAGDGEWKGRRRMHRGSLILLPSVARDATPWSSSLKQRISVSNDILRTREWRRWTEFWLDTTYERLESNVRLGASVGTTPKILQSTEEVFMQVTEKGKVLQTIASVIEALPPAPPIPPVEATATPIVQKMEDILDSNTTREILVILQLEMLVGISKGLTRATDDLSGLDEDSEVQQILERVNLARRNDWIARLREAILAAIGRCVEAT
ncbi:hypothetical protein F5146DRAFT_1001348 [Armillaria mellea]|nr:hypothetical protein F5146DRAFT_1001348 [Armillaria mellea]